MSKKNFCIAPGCKNNSENAESSDKLVHFHEIKQNSEWLEFCGINLLCAEAKSIAKQKDAAICSEHFKYEDYEDQVLLTLRENGE